MCRLPLPQQYRGHSWLTKSDAPAAKFTDTPFIWNAKGAVASVLKQARAGLEGYELRGRPSVLIAHSEVRRQPMSTWTSPARKLSGGIPPL